MPIALTAIAAASALLQPSGKWALSYDVDGCRLSRSFGSADLGVTARIDTISQNFGARLWLIDGIAAKRMPSSSGAAEVRVGPSDARFATQYMAGPMGDGRRAIQIDVDAQAQAALPSAETLYVQAGRFSVALDLRQAAPAFAALGDCIAKLNRRWGLDPDEASGVATPARPTNDIAGWITPHDYPAKARRANVSGTAIIAWAIGLDGRAHSCRAVVSSGSQLLDEASCAAVSERARYDPAIGRDGKPMVTHQLRYVTWTVPAG